HRSGRWCVGAASRDFDFGKFRHDRIRGECGLCGAPNIPNIGRIPMLIRLLLSLAVSLFVASAAVAQADKQVPEQVDEPALYDMLLREIALQRGYYALAAKTYLQLPQQKRDPRVAAR